MRSTGSKALAIEPCPTSSAGVPAVQRKLAEAAATNTEGAVGLTDAVSRPAPRQNSRVMIVRSSASERQHNVELTAECRVVNRDAAGGTARDE